MPDTTLFGGSDDQPDPDEALTSTNWIDSIRWWVAHMDDAMEQGVSSRAVLLCIRTAADHAIECQEAEA